MYSVEHKNFLKKKKRKKVCILFIQIFLFLFFLFLWEFCAEKGYINTFIFSSPKKVFETLLKLHKTNSLYHHIWITIYETLLSFGMGTIIGLVIASILWWFRTLYEIFDPYLTILNSLPKVALGPIIIIWAGAGMKSIILMALFISVVITIINLYQGFQEVDLIKIKLMQALGAKKYQIYLKLILPSSIPTLISTLKVNISLTLIGVIMGEFLVSKEGIGYLIMYGSQVFNLNLVITGIFILGVVATILYYFVCFIEKRLIKKD